MLFAVILTVCAMTGWLIATSNITPSQRDEMLRDEEMWP
jgi:hypothetical protein